MKFKRAYYLILPVLAAACMNHNENKTSPSDPTKPVAVEPQINVVVNITARELSVLKGADTIKKYPIAVGKAKYPTPTGNFKISRIDFNPDWTPPEGDWAKNKDYAKPGSPENPMGRARIVYQMPYTIHGTKDINSLGEAESHGSIRMANNHVIELAKLIMKESGTEKPESWYQQVLADSTKMVQTDLTNDIPLKNVE